MSDPLLQSVEAASTPRTEAAIKSLYHELQQHIDLRRPICTASGRCCRFEEFGHRLYVTTLELAAFKAALKAGSPNPNATGNSSGGPLPPQPLLRVLASAGETRGGCPFQAEGLCSVHANRPFGCRVFFCDATAEQWQQEQYEHFHSRLKALHGDLSVPYFYVEWREAIRRCELAVLPLPR